MNKRREKRKHEILDGVISVIAKHGFNGATTKKIAQHLGIAEGTIYRYFKSKEDIFKAIVQDKGEILQEKIIKSVSNIPDAREKLKKLIYIHFAYLEEHPEFAEIMSRELRSITKGIENIAKKYFNKYLKTLQQIIESGITQGVIKKKDKKFAALTLFGLIDVTVLNWLFSKRTYSLIKWEELIFRTFLHGFSEGN